ncbi:MAG: hypothetical protein U0892_08665 [Pirellulales bacterium]
MHCQAALLALLQQSPELGPMYPNTLSLTAPFHCHCSLLDVADLLHVDADTIPTYPRLHQTGSALGQLLAVPTSANG